MRKTRILLIVFVVFMLGFSACGKSDDSSNIKEETQNPASSAKTQADDSSKTSGRENKFDVFNIVGFDKEASGGFLDFDFQESAALPEGLPKFMAGNEIEVDIADFPDANWAKGYEKVSKSDVNDFANLCNETGYRVTGFYTNDEDSDETIGLVIGVSHSKKTESYTVVYNYEAETIYVGNYNMD